jgi:hypothetical protein
MKKGRPSKYEKPLKINAKPDEVLKVLLKKKSKKKDN